MTYKAFILLAGGNSNRMGSEVSDKILSTLLGKTVFSYSLSVFIRSNAFQEGVIVYRDEAQRRALEAICTEELNRLGHEGNNIQIPLKWTQGGNRRQDSSLAGIQATSENIEWVYIHDCARPCLTLEILNTLIEEAVQYKAAILAHAMTDTVKQPISENVNQVNVLKSKNNEHTHTPLFKDLEKNSRTATAITASKPVKRFQTVPREELFCAQTPQAFQKSIILKAHLHALKEGINLTDDASALEAIKHPIHMIVHTRPNPKLTYPHDFLIAEAVLKNIECGT